MTEPATATATAEPTPSAPAAEPITWENSPIAAIYNPDGTPKAEAATALAELGHEEVAGFALRNGQDFFAALKSGKDNQAAARQKTEGMVKIPGEDATDEDRAAFNQSLGALSSAEDYAAQLWPDNLPEGFQKDEALAGLLSEHAAKHPVNTPAGMQELVGKYIEHQKAQQEAMTEQFQKESEEAATKTAEALTVEMGGTAAFDKFSVDMKEMVTGDSFTDLGFEFTRNQDGTVSSDNPLHAAMLSDPATLRLLKERLDSNKPAGLPGQVPSTMSSEDREEKAREYYAKHGAGGFKSSKHLAEYNRLRGISA